MEFLNIDLTKDSSRLLHAIHSAFYLQILKKTILFSGFKNPYEKIRAWEDSSLCQQTSTKNVISRIPSQVWPLPAPTRLDRAAEWTMAVYGGARNSGGLRGNFSGRSGGGGPNLSGCYGGGGYYSSAAISYYGS